MERFLSDFEKAFCLSEPLIPLNFSLVACFTGELNETTVKHTLIRLHKHYQSAALRLDHNEQGEPFFTSSNVPVFPLKIIEQQQEGSWQQIAAEELGISFDLSKGPLIRVTLLKRYINLKTNNPVITSELILTFHHGVADGISAVNFLRDLIILLSDPQAELQLIPQSPDLVSLIPDKYKNSFSLNAKVLGMKGGLWLIRNISCFQKRYPAANRLIEGFPPWQHFALTSRCLTISQTVRLATLCKEQRTSIHSAICVAWLRALLDSNPEIKNSKRIISNPVDLRELLDIYNAFGMFISNAVITINCYSNKDFWELAREFKLHLNQNIMSGQVYRWLLAMNKIIHMSSSNLRKIVPAFATQPVNYDFSISNLGRLPYIFSNGSAKLESVYGPIVNTSEREMTIGVSTACNQLTMTLTYRDFVLNSTNAEKMADRAIEVLGQVTGW